jgi:hypothetical protein
MDITAIFTWSNLVQAFGFAVVIWVMQVSFQSSAQQTRQQSGSRAMPTLPARPADLGKASPVPAQSDQDAAEDDNVSNCCSLQGQS